MSCLLTTRILAVDGKTDLDRDMVLASRAELVMYGAIGSLPRPDLLPAFDTEISEVPSTANPLGMRGGSEGSITPGLAAVANAIVDALAEFGVEHIELPATPEHVWNAIRIARRREGTLALQQPSDDHGFSGGPVPGSWNA